MIVALSFFVPRVIKHNNEISAEISDDYTTDDEQVLANETDDIPQHGAPDNGNTQSQDRDPETALELRLSEDAVKYGVTELSGIFTTYANLNFRKGPSTSYDILSTSPKGSKVHIIGRTSNGWYQVVINDMVGYMCDDYLDGQGKLTLNTFNMDRVVDLAMKKAASKGIGTVEEWMEQRVNEGKMSYEEYTLLSPSGKGDYFCAVFETSGKNFFTCDGETLDSEDAIAEYLVNRFITDDVENCYFENNGIFTIGGKSYHEIRCYTKSGKSDFVKKVEEHISSAEYEDDPADSENLEDTSSEETDTPSDQEEEIDYNNQYSE